MSDQIHIVISSKLAYIPAKKGLEDIKDRMNDTGSSIGYQERLSDQAKALTEIVDIHEEGHDFQISVATSVFKWMKPHIVS